MRTIEEEQYAIQCLQLLNVLLDIRMNEAELYKQAFVDSALFLIMDSYIEFCFPSTLTNDQQDSQQKKEGDEDEEEKGGTEKVIQKVKNSILNTVSEK